MCQVPTERGLESAFSPTSRRSEHLWAGAKGQSCWCTDKRQPPDADILSPKDHPGDPVKLPLDIQPGTEGEQDAQGGGGRGEGRGGGVPKSRRLSPSPASSSSFSRQG